jgi:hypothetical protein
MKTRSGSGIIVIALIIITAFLNFFFTCSTEEENDPCEETKWIESKEPMVYIKFTLKQFSIENQYNSHEAEDAIIMVNIAKYYCPDKKSTMFMRTQTIHPNKCEPQYLEQGFYLEQPYQFKFANDLDYLELEYQLSLYVPKRYEWQDTLIVFYPDLIYDYNLNSYYIPIIIEDWYPK